MTPRTGVINHPDVLSLLTRQHFVAAFGQLADRGVSKQMVHDARQRGLVVKMYRGVVAVAGVELSLEGRALAAQLAAGPGAFVSGPTAGLLHGLRSMPHERLEVTVMQRFSSNVIAPHRLAVTSWVDEARDVIVRPDGLRIASPLRMLFGLAGQFNRYRFERAAEDVWHRGLATPADAEEYLSAIRRSGRTGVRRMEEWLERTSLRPRPSQSGLEVHFAQLIERAGLPAPERQYPLELASREVVKLDLAWPDARLAIEPGHSWWHGGDEQQRKDQARDRACAVVGWHVLRYDETAQLHPSATARELRALYERRVADLR